MQSVYALVDEKMGIEVMSIPGQAGDFQTLCLFRDRENAETAVKSMRKELRIVKLDSYFYQLPETEKPLLIRPEGALHSG